MKIAIVEDELLAATYLKQLLEEQNIIEITELDILRSKKEAIAYFSANTVDLIFMDIHLGDGKSLEIFEEIELKTPIIFTTAYDEYALKVFKHFTIDYILKPFEDEDLYQALAKYETIRSNFDISLTLNTLATLENNSKTTTLHKIAVSNGHKLHLLNERDIAYFFASGKHLFITTNEDKTYIYDDTVKDLIEKLDTSKFFKINRKYIINRDAIVEVVKHSSQKIEVILSPSPEIKTEILVSKMQLSEWRNWLMN
ncbi:LytTR family DNA-binding domain-containing protein [Chishuiella changwenlii]|jgi:DNA-binding LytR/AlgR family response regulator|uniref:LytR/AlgR family response regulator transcription factor n=1 Tax=Chishuiella changwenlii TaxID=1434701 RepID=UPI002FDA89C8